MDSTETMAQARAAYWAYQDDHLARTSLTALDAWIATGAPPPASEIVVHETDPHATSMARRAFVRRWGFSIPCREAVTALRELGPIVELGAGTAYWTSLMRNAGLDVVATDPGSPNTDYGFELGRYADCEPLSAREAVTEFADRAVFCSWPSQGEPWLSEALALTPPGRQAALILDARPMMTGDDGLRALLGEAFELVSVVEIPRFPRVQDRLEIYRRI